ncbi:hypothetical protein Baya_5121 [Bagarius yarrelli]|uniref:Uncharacterized protein n=1 Tax=Bagarius yarrelli TaxID=175774 RepID=A0A556TVF9_BAGYA|nr:hypothetical protein Baya_5121 [Bagarius yarrelli]
MKDGQLQWRMNEQSTVMFALIDGQCQAKRPSCLAAMSFSTSALLLCEEADQTRRRAGGLLFVIRGEVEAALAWLQVGKNALMRFYHLLFLSI